MNNKENNGKVWLVGAGPGDQSLLTQKAVKLIKNADLIVYDALISAEIMSLVPSETQTCYVGKHSGNHAVPQDEINKILVREAKKGKKVIRLKGGDPLVFGRGGEELELLVKEGIPFEIVPGITSSVAVPAYAGIPVTHRDYTSSFHVITGHARKDGQLHMDYQSLVRLNGTLVFLMGVASMESLMKGLVDAGMDPDMPAAVIENGTTAAQRKVTATVSTLKEKSDLAGIHTPAVIIVGKVCALSDKFQWSEDRILGGKQFLLTRPRQNISQLAETLRCLGAQVIEMPAIRIEVISPNRRLKEALVQFAAVTDEKWIVLTSPVGVNVFFDQLVQLKIDLRTLLSASMVRFAAIGSATAEALRKHGIFPDLVPEVYNACHLGKKLAETACAGSHILIARAEKGSEELLPPLVNAQMQVEDIPLYQTVYESHPVLEKKVGKMFAAGEIDAVVFTSASTVRGFVQAAGHMDFSCIHAVCIGEQTAGEAEKYGMKTDISDQASMEAITDKIIELFGKIKY